MARKQRDILDYAVIFSSLVATGFTIYFLYQKFKAQNKPEVKSDPKPEKVSGINVILD
jgi:hypothetical protein